MDLVQIKRLSKLLEKARLEEHILETFILVLMESGTESHGKNNQLKYIEKSIIAQIIMMLMLINMLLSVEHH